MNEYGYETEQRNKGNDTLKIVLIAVSAVCCVLMIIALILFFALPGSSQAPVLNITSCPERVSMEGSGALVKGTIYDSDSPCELYINGEKIAVTAKKGEQANWEKTFMVSSGESLQLNFEVRDNKGNNVTDTRMIYGVSKEEQASVSENTNQTVTYSYPSYAQGTRLVKNTQQYNSTVNIRSGPGTGYTSIAELGHGQTATYISNYGNGWYYVQAPNGKKGYISAQYVKVASSASSYSSLYQGCQLAKNTKNPNSTVNIRSGPGTGYTSIAELGHGQTATYISNYGNGWYYVQAPNGKRGYISAQYVMKAY